MKSIKALFLRKQKENPCWGDYICLAEAINGKRYARKSISRAMDKLLAESIDWYSYEKKLYLRHLESLSNPSTKAKRRGKMPPKA